MELEDTIVAVSSPPGSTARGIVRLSGPLAIDIASKVFRPSGDQSLSRAAGPTRVSGYIAFGERTMPAFACVFKRPRSYTRQDMVELHLLGAPTLLGMVMEQLLEAGARQAQPGEFTARAFLSGVMDASQVHGVAGLIAARSDQQLRAAEQLLHGSLSQTALAARETLADLLSLVEGAMDFADEPIEFITPNQLVARLSELREQLAATVSAGVRTERGVRLPTVVLTGPPNAGKSSLFNRLTGMDRAICTPIAGTTRDAISAPMVLGDSECLLIDTAGIENARDELDAAAQSATSLRQRHADVLVRVVDCTSNTPLPLESDTPNPSIIAANKCDLIPPEHRAARLAALNQQLGALPLLVSARTGEGCDALRARIAELLSHGESDAREPGIALMAEYREALDRAVEALDRAMTLARDSRNEFENSDLVAVELRAAAESLGVLVGRDDSEALLGRIFSRFCIGK